MGELIRELRGLNKLLRLIGRRKIGSYWHVLRGEDAVDTVRAGVRLLLALVATRGSILRRVGGLLGLGLLDERDLEG